MTPLERQIIRDVAAEHGIELKLLLSRRRTRPVAYARQAAMYALHKTPTSRGRMRSYGEVGRLLGRDHTTVIQGVHAHAQRMAQA